MNNIITLKQCFVFIKQNTFFNHKKAQQYHHFSTTYSTNKSVLLSNNLQTTKTPHTFDMEMDQSSIVQLFGLLVEVSSQFFQSTYKLIISQNINFAHSLSPNVPLFLNLEIVYLLQFCTKLSSTLFHIEFSQVTTSPFPNKIILFLNLLT